jgi:isopenicillin N synthase-like dioxygenase
MSDGPTGLVPVVDVSGDPERVGRAIDLACRQVGFFQIVGHGLDRSVEAAGWRAAAEFFRLPVVDKMSVVIPPGDAYGYGPFQVERLAASLGESTPPDLKETFSVGPGRESCEAHLVTDPAAAFVFSESRWPTALPGMEAALRAYYDALAELVERVMSLMALGLGLAPNHFEPFIDRHTSALRSLHYPDLRGHGVEQGQLRAGAHSDYGTLTLLRQDDAPGGLQVRDVSGVWHDVPALQGAYVVNVGDALERWTNDLWKSTLHRVVVPPQDADRDCSRQSMAFFHNANWGAVIDALPTCLADDEAPRHQPITAGRHLMDKFLSTQS